MNDPLKIQDTHRQRCAYVYIRQSSATQVLVNRESTQRQYQLSERAAQLGWAKTLIKVIDEDLAHSGSGVVTRNGFTQMTHEVAMGQVGIILCLEASRIARNNTEWYRLLELCGVTDTLIGDLDGLYHPGLFNDRLLLGLKGTMAEAELHVLRMRLNGAIRNKAKRGELRRGLPVGLVWGEGEGQVIFHPDQAALKQFRLQVERTRYEAERAERRFRSVEPENRLVARTLETEWETKLHDQKTAEAELARKEHEQRLQLTDPQREQIRALGGDLKRVWDAPTTTDRDRKELLRSLLEEVKIDLLPENSKAHLVLRWKTSAVSELDVIWRVPRVATVRTDEETIDLMRRLAVHHPDTVIAGVLNSQGRKTARGENFTAGRVASLRKSWKIPCYEPPTTPPLGELLTLQAAADQLGVAASTLLRWLNDGFIGGEQVTPGAPWRIRMTQELKNLIVPEVPSSYVTVFQDMRILGVSRQTIMQRVKRGELSVVHVSRGKQKGLRIHILDNQTQLVDQPSTTKV